MTSKQLYQSLLRLIINKKDRRRYFELLKRVLNPVTAITSQNTDEQLPSAKAVYDLINNNFKITNVNSNEITTNEPILISQQDIMKLLILIY